MSTLILILRAFAVVLSIATLMALTGAALLCPPFLLPAIIMGLLIVALTLGV